MIYLIGVLGFAGGFVLGQMILYFLLRQYTKKEILAMMDDKGKRFKYGMINWICAALGSASFIQLYKTYFP